MNPVPGAESTGATVEVRIPASAVHIPTVRTVAADLAGRQDFDLDGIHDLRMAVDEACAELAALAAASSSLRCVFVVNPDQIEVTVTVSVPELLRISTNSFGWRVLSTLTDLVEPVYQPDTPDGHLPNVGIRLRVNKDRTTTT
jgi:serine/threonine-protein kinase RsbW